MAKRVFYLFAALTLVVSVASAGDQYLGDTRSGSSCENSCPLAQTANQRYATGCETLFVTSIIQQEFVQSVLENLEAI